MAGRTVCAAAVALALQAALATVARGDGLPVLGFVGGAHGVRAADGSRRYLAQPRRRVTIVKALSRSGRTLERAVIPGRFDVPVVAYDGSTSGLSANGRTLVLIRPRVAFPQRSTELVIVAARTLHPLRFERLRGDFSFDAISPSGTWVYLIQYTSRVDPTRYRVRALSSRTGQLLARDIVDPHDRGEAMRGNPMSRLTSPDGRWAYTLYDGDGHPFVHALDTVRLRARCIDIAAFPAGGNLLGTRLRLTGRTLSVVQGGRTLTEIDTRSLSVIAPPRPARAASANRSKPTTRGDARTPSGAPAVLVPIAAAVALLAGAALALRRRLARLRRRVQLQ
jgi:hypothetical protein